MRNLFPEITKRQNGIFDFGPSLLEGMTDAFFKPMNMDTFKVDVHEQSDKYTVKTSEAPRKLNASNSTAVNANT